MRPSGDLTAYVGCERVDKDTYTWDTHKIKLRVAWPNKLKYPSLIVSIDGHNVIALVYNTRCSEFDMRWLAARDPRWEVLMAIMCDEYDPVVYKLGELFNFSRDFVLDASEGVLDRCDTEQARKLLGAQPDQEVFLPIGEGHQICDLHGTLASNLYDRFPGLDWREPTGW